MNDQPSTPSLDTHTKEVWGNNPQVWGLGERLVPEIMGQDAASQKLIDYSYKNYEIAAQAVAGRRVLDLACGTGYGGPVLAQAGAAKVVCVDICPQTVEYARQRHSFGNLQYLCGDAEKFEWPEPFEVICSFETLEHLKAPQSFLERLRNLLVADGRLFLSVPLGETRHWDPYHLHAFERNQIFAMLQKADFEVDLYRDDVWGMTRAELAQMSKRFPDAQPSLANLFLSGRGWRVLADYIFRNGFRIPQLLVAAHVQAR